MTEGCVMTLTQDHISEFMVTVHTYPKPCPGHKLSLPSWILIIYHAIVSWPWLRDISPRSRSQFTHGKIFFPDHYLLWVSQMGMIFHTVVIHDPGVVGAGGICPVRTCLVSIGEGQVLVQQYSHNAWNQSWVKKYAMYDERIDLLKWLSRSWTLPQQGRYCATDTCYHCAKLHWTISLLCPVT